MSIEYLWTKNIKMPTFPSLKGTVNTDVLIIGGGMAGVLCALRLKEAGVDYVLAEGKTVGGGITKGTTAVLTAQHDTLYQDIVKKFGEEKARLYLKANLDAVNEFGELSRKIPCDFERKPSFMYTLYDSEKLDKEAKTLKRLGFNASFTRKTPLPFKVAGGVKFPEMAQFHPLKFLSNAVRGLNIYEHTFVNRIDKTTAYTQNGVINAKKIIVATHFPFINRHGFYFVKLYQRRSYVIAYENASDIGCTVDNFDKDGFYLRNYNGLLIIGGGTKRTGKGCGFDTVSDFASKYYPKAKEKYRWANQDCESLDGIPYIGRYSAAMPDVFVASGFNLWGMTTSLVASLILTDAVIGKENKYSEVFTTDRSALTGQLFANLGSAVLELAMPVTKRCSHMGCALKWNPQEHTWDCPCHGSRFDKDGNVIDNPAIKRGLV